MRQSGGYAIQATNGEYRLPVALQKEGPDAPSAQVDSPHRRHLCRSKTLELPQNGIPLEMEI
jgi:hypothetical protein